MAKGVRIPVQHLVYRQNSTRVALSSAPAARQYAASCAGRTGHSTPAEEMIRGRPHQRKGSKTKPCLAIYEQGKTPKTLDWLNQALRKVGIQQ